MTITLLSSPPDLSNLTIRHTQNDIGLDVSPSLAGSNGTIQGKLYVCESLLYFYSESSNAGIAVEYPDIIIHAISRQSGEPSIYCQLNAGLFFPNQQLPEDEDHEDIVTELTFTPRDTNSLEDIYMALSDCAALHPDEEFMAEQAALEQENDETFYANPSDETELNEVQQAALRHLESVFDSAPTQNGNNHSDERNHQFDDAMDDN
ncbi:regulator of volume decrease after cellular swelling-domain-containing protein [Halteromyces radiatus]|uniref:regulator of volume decrease after cellular swelling-domain-containing protein n=1 Tax=Halteromyces radiatus TaxID=101107 RepID=UPI00221E648A|nr:regulator of volume decrease after cellular swelling-domain-containing protein [Halteromyces radiatus]KAI8086340.1 regulator of volume decrease after cellular swelling-domain-containing protein [Halteromyces radiatus]